MSNSSNFSNSGGYPVTSPSQSSPPQHASFITVQSPPQSQQQQQQQQYVQLINPGGQIFLQPGQLPFPPMSPGSGQPQWVQLAPQQQQQQHNGQPVFINLPQQPWAASPTYQQQGGQFVLYATPQQQQQQQTSHTSSILPERPEYHRSAQSLSKKKSQPLIKPRRGHFGPEAIFHEILRSKGCTYVPFPGPDDGILRPPPPRMKRSEAHDTPLYGLFFGQIDFECSFSVLQWMIEVTTNPSVTPVSIKRKGAGCAMVYFSGPEEAVRVRDLNGRILFDYNGIWYAGTDAAKEELAAYTKSIPKPTRLPGECVVIRD